MQINGEECRLIEGFERYHVSVSGRFYRTTALNKKEEKILEDGANYVVENQVYFRILDKGMRQGTMGLSDTEGKLFNIMACIVVAQAFGLIGNDFNRKKKEIGFIDGNKRNLHLENLKVVDFRYKNSKLSKEDVRKIKRLIADGVTLKELAETYGVSDMQINRIKTGENWGNGKRKIKAPEAPFPIKDGRIRKYIAIFDRTPIEGNVKKTFRIKRNPDEPIDNLIYGIVNGYKLSIKHKNITRARVIVDMLNEYFFSKKEPVNDFYDAMDEIEEKFKIV